MTEKALLCSVSKIMSRWEEETECNSNQAKSSNVKSRAPLKSYPRLLMLLMHKARPDVPKSTPVSPSVPLTDAQ